MCGAGLCHHHYHRQDHHDHEIWGLRITWHTQRVPQIARSPFCVFGFGSFLQQPILLPRFSSFQVPSFIRGTQIHGFQQLWFLRHSMLCCSNACLPRVMPKLEDFCFQSSLVLLPDSPGGKSHCCNCSLTASSQLRSHLRCFCRRLIHHYLFKGTLCRKKMLMVDLTWQGK